MFRQYPGRLSGLVVCLDGIGADFAWSCSMLRQYSGRILPGIVLWRDSIRVDFARSCMLRQYPGRLARSCSMLRQYPGRLCQVLQCA